MNGYQSLTGTYEGQDILEVNNLIVAKDAHIGGDLSVKGALILPDGAALDYVLKSDADGLASWKVNDLYGDITGLASATVQHNKWIGNWSSAAQYQRFNRVTHKHIEYRALSDNSVEPSADVEQGH